MIILLPSGWQCSIPGLAAALADSIVKMVSIVSTLSEQTLALFDRTGAYLKGHFRLTSGLHSPEYLQCALVLQHPEIAEQLGRDLAGELRAAAGGAQIQVVAAPAIGGLIVGHEVARALNARFVFTERDVAGKMSLRRGFTVQPGQNAVVVEDVITTGGSLLEVVALLKKAGANVLAAGAIIDRSGGRVELGVPKASLATLNATTYNEQACPLCKDDVPVTKPGSRPAAGHAPNEAY
jgi:orotate phosphoribosyltransferase